MVLAKEALSLCHATLSCAMVVIGFLDYALNRSQRCLLPDSHLSGLSAVPSILFRRVCLPIPCPVLLLVHGTTSVYRSLLSDFGVGTP